MRARITAGNPLIMQQRLKLSPSLIAGASATIVQERWCARHLILHCEQDGSSLNVFSLLPLQGIGVILIVGLFALVGSGRSLPVLQRSS